MMRILLNKLLLALGVAVTTTTCISTTCAFIVPSSFSTSHIIRTTAKGETALCAETYPGGRYVGVRPSDQERFDMPISEAPPPPPPYDGGMVRNNGGPRTAGRDAYVKEMGSYDSAYSRFGSNYWGGRGNRSSNNGGMMQDFSYYSNPIRSNGAYTSPYYNNNYNNAGSGYLQGGSRNTWWNSNNYAGVDGEPTRVELGTEGRPLMAEFEVWEGPNNTPQKMKVYSEDGGMWPLQTFVERPDHGYSSPAMSIRNDGSLEFPLHASVQGSGSASSWFKRQERRFEARNAPFDTIQGNSRKTYQIDPMVSSVIVEIQTDGNPLNAIIELWNGPNNTPQSVEVYTEDGDSRPFIAVIETPGGSNTVSIRNSGPIAYPIKASVEPYRVGGGGGYGRPPPAYGSGFGYGGF